MSTGEDLTSAIDPYMSGPAFGESILWRTFELSPTAFCCYTATVTRLLQRNIAGILPGKDTMCVEKLQTVRRGHVLRSRPSIILALQTIRDICVFQQRLLVKVIPRSTSLSTRFKSAEPRLLLFFLFNNGWPFSELQLIFKGPF
jgi:hypothetical protein